jgi:hypothetical protein
MATPPTGAVATPVPPTQPGSVATKTTNVVRVEIADRTAGQSLSAEQRRAITEEIVKRVRAVSNAVEVSSHEGQSVQGIYRANIDVFTAGNRALRFWVGFGAGKAHLKFTAQWLDGATKQVQDSKEFQRFGAMSLRSGGEIEQQMTELIGEYSQEFLAPHLK